MSFQKIPKTIIFLLILSLLIIGVIIYVERDSVDTLDSNEITTDNSLLPDNTLAEQPTVTKKSYTFDEIESKELTITYNSDLEILKNINEPNRRGSIVSYDSSPTYSNEYQFPSLSEVQLFTRESIGEYEMKCENDFCFDGDVHTVTRFDALRKAFLNKADYQDFKAISTAGRTWLVKTHKPASDYIYIQEYITFYDQDPLIMTSVIIHTEVSQEGIKKAGELFKSIIAK